MFVPTLLVACADDPPGRVARPVSDLVLTDANNFRTATRIELASVEVASGDEACVDWSAVTGSAPLLLLSDLRMPIADAEQVILEEELGAFDGWFAESRPAVTVTCISEFEVLGNLPEFEEDPDVTWVFTVPVGTCGVAGPSVVLVPSDASPNREVVLTDTTSPVVTTAVLGEPLEARDGTVPVLDWSGLGRDGIGEPFDPAARHRLQVARLEATDPAAVAEGVVDLEGAAVELYGVDVDGLYGDSLAHARDAFGAPFRGFTTDGTWVVAFSSGTCRALPPLVVAVVAVTPP